MDWDCTPSPTAGPEAARLRVAPAVKFAEGGGAACVEGASGEFA